MTRQPFCLPSTSDRRRSLVRGLTALSILLTAACGETPLEYPTTSPAPGRPDTTVSPAPVRAVAQLDIEGAEAPLLPEGSR